MLAPLGELYKAESEKLIAGQELSKLEAWDSPELKILKNGKEQFEKKIKEFATLTTGIVETYYDVRSELYEDHTANNLAVFAQADLKFGKLGISLGGRLESNQSDGGDKESIPVFRSGLNYQLFKFTHLRASYGQGYSCLLYTSDAADARSSVDLGGRRIINKKKKKKKKKQSVAETINTK